MSEQSYELNNFGKCLDFMHILAKQCIIVMMVVVFGLIIIGLLLVTLVTPCVYIYYVTQNNWNVIVNDDNQPLTSIALIGFAYSCVFIFIMLLALSTCVWRKCGLNDLYQSFILAVFYKKINQEINQEINEETLISNPVANVHTIVNIV